VRKLRKHQDETKKNKEEIRELKSGAKIFQIQKCTRCQLALDLPAIHYLCNHSFHQRCLGDVEAECPECAEDNKRHRKLNWDMEQNAKKPNEFFRRMETASDGFTVVADYFGLGLFNKAPTTDGDGLPTLDLFNLSGLQL